MSAQSDAAGPASGTATVAAAGLSPGTTIRLPNQDATIGGLLVAQLRLDSLITHATYSEVEPVPPEHDAITLTVSAVDGVNPAARILAASECRQEMLCEFDQEFRKGCDKFKRSKGEPQASAAATTAPPRPE